MITTRNKRWFRVAEHASQFSDYWRVKVGACLVYKNKVLSIGWNSTKTHTFQKEYNRNKGWNTAEFPNRQHAEVNALCKVRYRDIDWSNVECYVFRRNLNGELAIVKPCEGCQIMLAEFGITKIYYTGDKSYMED
jgi:deoxycytidylate deaminase